MIEKIDKTDDEWRDILPPKVFQIVREKGTERPFTGLYYKHSEKGVYRCAACALPLFDSETKFDSGSGWPSFFAPVSEDSIETEPDTSLGMVRVEIHCARCGGHLGHVFEDGPKPTGLRYCVNSASLSFERKE